MRAGSVLLAVALLGCRTEAPAPAVPASAEAAYRAAEAIHRAAASAGPADRPARLAEARAAYAAFLVRHPAAPRWSAEAAFGAAQAAAAAGETGPALAALAEIEERFPAERWTRLRALKTRAEMTADPAALYARIVEVFGGAGEPPAVRAVVAAARRRASV